jgi:hypothetical protein
MFFLGKISQLGDKKRPLQIGLKEFDHQIGGVTMMQSFGNKL